MIKPGLGRGDMGDREILGLEGVDESVCDGRFVFDDEDGGHRVKG